MPRLRSDHRRRDELAELERIASLRTYYMAGLSSPAGPDRCPTDCPYCYGDPVAAG